MLTPITQTPVTIATTSPAASEYSFNEVASRVLGAAHSGSDAAEISASSRFLFSNRIDLPNSSFSFGDQNFNFNLSFFDNQKQRVTATGSYSSAESSFSIDLNYQFKRVEESNGQKMMKEYNFNLNYSGSATKDKSAEIKVEKEDIIKYFGRIIDKILQTASSKDLAVGDVVIEQSDLNELGGMSDKDVGRKMLDVLYMAISVAKLKAMIDNNWKDREEVDIVEKRIQETLLEKQDTSSETKSITVSVEEIAAEVIAEVTGNGPKNTMAVTTNDVALPNKVSVTEYSGTTGE